jgi:sugar-phosphatase
VILLCQAILFDLDGVLVDSTPAVARVWGKWALAHRLPPEKVIAQAHGRRSIETIRALAPHLDANQENRHVEAWEIEDIEGVIALPGAAELLSSLPQERFCIVTSATAALARVRMQAAGLPLPTHLVGADDVLEGKPSPVPYLKGAERLGFPAHECLVFEDAPAGIASAQAAGMQVIALPNTYPAEELAGATAIIKSLTTVELELTSAGLSVKASLM